METVISGRSALFSQVLKKVTWLWADRVVRHMERAAIGAKLEEYLDNPPQITRRAAKGV